ncbi:hypothetical protein PAMC26510_23790 [Caballeronia sordidicola]|uniref:Uncharacterized protein n=1 Tax=Caballeronia sordidicola TaxID=196367 RepID=A0A242MIP8_CABSO|nr:hypothetical protein PAMC26510_23790 [Caballeronia sordidicola]
MALETALKSSGVGFLIQALRLEVLLNGVYNDMCCSKPARSQPDQSE